MAKWLDFRIFVVGVLFGIAVLFILLPLMVDLDTVDLVASIFNKVAVGLGALLAAISGSGYLKTLEETSLVKFYRQKYPIDQFGKQWKIVVSKKSTGTWYLLDLKTLQRYHIGNMKTVYDLGMQGLKREELDDSEFYSYIEGERIMTRGSVGE